MDRSRQLADEGSKMGMRMLQHINQALSSVDPQLGMGHVREAMLDGEELQEVIDQVMDLSEEGTVTADKVQAAGEHLRQAMTEGGAALTASESFMKTHVQSMRGHIDQLMTDLNAATIPINR